MIIIIIVEAVINQRRTVPPFCLRLAPIAKTRRRHGPNEVIKIAGETRPYDSGGRGTRACAAGQRPAEHKTDTRRHDVNPRSRGSDITGKRLLDFLVRCHRVSRRSNWWPLCTLNITHRTPTRRVRRTDGRTLRLRTAPASSLLFVRSRITTRRPLNGGRVYDAREKTKTKTH